MDILQYREFCLSLAHATEDMPFGDDVLVFKVGGKIFAYSPAEIFMWVGVKCDPSEVTELHERYSGIGYASHMNKNHWISLATDGSLDDGFIRERIRASYRLVLAGLPKAVRNTLDRQK